MALLECLGQSGTVLAQLRHLSGRAAYRACSPIGPVRMGKSTVLIVKWSVQRSGTRNGINRNPYKVAVQSLSLNIHQGELYALLGSNGAGKTITLRMIAVLLWKCIAEKSKC